MGKFKDKLYRFMYGRYGIDDLYKFCFLLAIILIVINLILSFVISNQTAQTIVTTLLFALILFLMVWNIVRSYSRKIEARRKENAAYLKLKRKVKVFFTGNTSTKSRSGNIDSAEYIFRDCPNCSSTLRLPRKDGKNKVKCPRCSRSFYVKSKPRKPKK